MQSWRVKVYLLNPSSGEWEDLGIGFTEVSPPEVKIIGENSNAPLINYQIQQELYRRQGDTILIWTDSAHRTYAISFQDPEGATEIWELFCRIQGRDPSAPFYEEEANFALPTPSPENLSVVLETLLRYSNPDSLVGILTHQNFIHHLGKEFEKAEAQGKEVTTYSLVYKGLLELGSDRILEELLETENCFGFLGALEYETKENGTFENYRVTLEREEANFKNVLGIKDPNLLKKIKTLFRLGFLKESQTAKRLDEVSIIFLNNFEYRLWTEIIFYFINDSSLRELLKEKFQTSDFGAFQFMSELCNIAKQVPFSTRNVLYQSLYQDGVFELIKDNWENCVWTPEQQAIFLRKFPDILSGVCQTSPNLLREFFHNQECSKFILPRFTEVLQSSEDICVVQQIRVVLTGMLEAEEDQNLCELIYDLVLTPCAKSICFKEDENHTMRLVEIIQLYTSCVRNHTYRIRYFLIYHEIIQKTTKLLDYSNKTLNLCVMRFIRTITEKNDLMLHKIVSSHNILQGVFRVFSQNGNKENMVFSCVLSILEAVKNCNSEVLVENIVTKHLPNVPKSLQHHFKELKGIQELHKRKKKVSEQELTAQEEFTEEEDIQWPLKRKLHSEVDPVKKVKTDDD